MSAASSFQARLHAHPQRLLHALIAWQMSVWVLVPLLAYTMLPLDTLEAVLWGREWQWGYYKHPPLGAWLAEAAVRACGGWLGAVYILAQAVLVATLIYVWKTARLFLDPVRAAMATTLLAGSYFHSVLIPNFNMNTLQLPLWAGLCYHLLRLLDGHRQHWWAFAVLAAMAILAKYSSLLIVASCGLVLLATAEGRRALLAPQAWLAALFGLALLAPHLLWLHEVDYLPLHYLGGFQSQGPAGTAAHLVEPLRFAVGSLLSLLPALLLFLFVFDRRASWPRPDRRALILLMLVLGPLLLTMAYGAWSGGRLKTTWAFPFYSLAGILLFRFLPTRADAGSLLRFVLAMAATCLLVLGLHLAYKLGSERSKTHFDGPALALAVNQAWRDQQPTPLPLVAGDHILTAIVAGYAPDSPRMLIDGDFRKSPWLSPAELRRGAVVICELERPCNYLGSEPLSPPEIIEIRERRFSLRLLAPRP